MLIPAPGCAQEKCRPSYCAAESQLCRQVVQFKTPGVQRAVARSSSRPTGTAAEDTCPSGGRAEDTCQRASDGYEELTDLTGLQEMVGLRPKLYIL